MYFESIQQDGYGELDLLVTTRASISEPWTTPVNLGAAINSPDNDMGASISTDGLELYFQSYRPGGFGQEDIYVSRRTTVSDPWGKAVNLGPIVNSPAIDGQPCISPDGLALFISSGRMDGFGDIDIWVTIRPTKNDEWGTPMNLGPIVNTSAGEAEPFLSFDERIFYFSDWWQPRAGGEGNIDLWKISISNIK
jgi:hypothetical protein